MAKVKFTPHRTNIALVATGPIGQKAIRHKAELVRIEIERVAPVVTGQYAFGTVKPGGIRIRDNPRRKGAVLVVATAPHARFLERGTRYMKARHILRDAALRVGGR